MMYKKELSKLHERMRNYTAEITELKRKIDLIKRVDYVKSEMLKLVDGNTNIPYKIIASDPQFRDELEALFNLPFEKIRDRYCEMLYERNDICHEYTMSYWRRDK